MRLPATALLVAIFNIFCLQPSGADNGAVAVARVLPDVRIDGDLGEWPRDMPILHVTYLGLGDPLSEAAGETDLEVEARVSYDPATNRLFVAVHVEDESIILLEQDQGWQNQDGCDIYLHIDHQRAGEPVSQYVLWGHHSNMFGALKTGESIRHLEVQARTTAVGRDYEFAIDLGDNGLDLLPHTTIGFDIAVNDVDKDGSSSWVSWGQGTIKAAFPERLGDLLFLDPEEELVELSGDLRWQDLNTPVADALINVRQEPAVNIDLLTDRQGRFDLRLPAGSYDLTPLGHVDDQTRVQLTQLRGPLALTVSPPSGTTMSAIAPDPVQAGQGVRQGFWQTYGLVDGLGSDVVHCITQDHDGDIWLGTDRGIVRFDGEEFFAYDERHGLPDGATLAIVQDHDGALWIGMEHHGVSRFDGDSFTTFSTRDGLVSNRVRTILQDRRGDLWFGTGAGLSKYDGHHFTSYTTEDGLVDNDVSDLFEDKEGNLWIGTGRLTGLRGGGLSRFDGQHFTNLGVADGLPHASILDLYGDGETGLWIGTSAGIARIVNGKPVIEGDVDLRRQQISSIMEDADQNLWFATGGVSDEGSGVARFDGDEIRHFDARNGLGADRVLCSFVDLEGALWFGTRDGGVTRYDGTRMSVFTTADGLPSNDTRHLLEDADGRVWVATAAGVGRFDGSRFETILTTQDGLPTNEIRHMLEARDGSLWLATGDYALTGSGLGLVRIDREGAKTWTVADGLGHDFVAGIAQDAAGDIWLATAAGLTRIHDDETTTFTTEHGLPQNRLSGLLIDEDDIWVTGQGITRFRDDRFTTFTVADGLPVEYWFPSVLDGAGRKWFGGSGSLSRLDESEFRHFTATDGLASAEILALEAGSENELWLATSTGVSRFDGQIFQSLHRRDGLPHHEARDLLVDRQGTVWIATKAGVARYRPRTSPLTLHLSDVIADRGYGPVDHLSLPPEQRFLAFELSTDRLAHRSRAIVYRYRLTGHDPGWRQTRETRIEYRDLWSGSFTFEVEAIDRDFNRSSIVRVQVEAMPAWYSDSSRFVPFLFLLLTLGGGAAFVIRRGIVQRVEAAALRRRQLARVRVREAVWKMQSADDIEEVLRSVATGMQELDIPFDFFGVNVLTSDTPESVDVYTMAATGAWHRRTSMSGPNILRFWRGGTTVYRRDLEREDLYGEGQMLHSGLRCVVDIPFSAGTLAVSSSLPNAFSASDLTTLEQLARVLEEGFHRLGDLRSIEQRRLEVGEAEKRLTSLERVREVIWGLEDAHAPAGLVAVINDCLEDLGVELDVCGVNVVESQLPPRVRTYETRWGEAVEPKVEDGTPAARAIIDFWRRQATVYRADLHHDDPHGELIVLEEAGVSQLPRCILDIPFSHGTLAVNSQQMDAFSIQDRENVELLASLLSDGFRRIADLHALEAQSAAEKEARLAAEQASRAKSVFLANMSHEIRTPMNAILGYAQILQGDEGLAPDQRSALVTIEQSGNHLLGLINDVLDISKIEAGHEEMNVVTFDLTALIETMSGMFEVRCQQKGLRWMLESEGLPANRVRGDERKLRQVLINLLANAVKFTTQGQVLLRVQHGLEPDSFRFEVSDTGRGIRPDQHEAIFEAFHQESAGVMEGGTGLGLAISRRYVMMLGGTLSLDSDEGAGARFHFEASLPLAQGPTDADDLDWERALRLSPGQHIRALVVDDIETNRDVLGQILSRIGVDVRLAASGQEALYHAEAEKPDIVFMDMRMPEMDGAETRRRLLRQHGPVSMKIVAVTASVLEHQQEEYLREGFDGFVDKPLKAGRVYAALNQHTGALFDFSDIAATQEEIDVSWAHLQLPTQITEGLRSAIANHSITELRRQVEGLEGLGEQGRLLAAHLNDLTRQYDLPAIEKIIDALPSPTTPTPADR